MSELIDNVQKKKDLLKHMILQLHEGIAPEEVKIQLIRLMGEVPYHIVVEAEQELIAEGLPAAEVLKLCDIHAQALKGVISQEGSKDAPPGHPVHTFKEENRALAHVTGTLSSLYEQLSQLDDEDDATEIYREMHRNFNLLMDVEKHYQRKENLLFPFLEKKGVTGPPTVMWGKHDEARELLKNALQAFEGVDTVQAGEAKTVVELVLKPASTAVEDMIYKEEEILFPMCLDKLNDEEWYQIYRQSLEIGFCLYDPTEEWHPEGVEMQREEWMKEGRIQLPSGGFTPQELLAILSTIPFDMTFVDKDDNVRFFTQGKERIFSRSRAILGRKVQYCHPPSSVHIVQKILDDFRAGKRNLARFWITLRGKFIVIEYYALRGENGEYLGTLEVSQDLTEKRALEGERRLLKYDGKE